MSQLFIKHIDNNLSELKKVRDELQRIFVRFNFQKEVIDRNLLIVTEYLSNLFRHAEIPRRHTILSLEKIQQSLTIRIVDNSPLHLPLKNLLAQDECGSLTAGESGMGMMLIQQCIESYEYQPIENGCEFSFVCGHISSSRPIVLVVDDDPFMLTLLTEYLAEQYDVITSESVAEAISQLDKITPDLIISDIEMPDCDGIGFRNYLANNLKLDLLPFIYLTGVSDEQVKELAISYGIDDYLQKPVNKQDLLSRVNRIIRRYKQRHHSQSLISDQKQQSQMQSRLPKQLEDLLIRFRQQTADSMSGDFVLHHHQDGSDYLVLGDVMGHGIDAAFYSYSYAGYIRAFLRASKGFTSLADLTKELSASIYQDKFLEQQLMTLLLIKCSGQHIEIISAGHPAPVIINSHSVKFIDVSGPLPGLFEDQVYQATSLVLSDDASVLMYTDGLTDALATDVDSSLADCLGKAAIYDEDPEQCLENIMSCLPAKSERAVNDDISCLLLSNQR